MTNLITLSEAKRQLMIATADTTHDTDISERIANVTDILMDYLKLAAFPDDWYTDASPPLLIVPGRVKGAALLMLTDLNENREGSKTDIISPAVKSILMRSRDPALA
jgi:hypothetical protein